MSDPQRILKQYLHSLHKAGVSHIPREFLQVEFPEVSAVAVDAVPKAVTVVKGPNIAETVPPAPVLKKNVESKSDETMHVETKNVAEVPVSAQTENISRSTDQQQLRESSAAWVDLTQDEKDNALAILQNEVTGCTRCSELAQTRTQTVFGVGNPRSKLVFLGEAPGADEDRLGEPFVGLAGQKLDEIIEKGMRLKRSDVYIMNVLRCRPPGNRNPSEEEAQNCRGFLDRQLAIIKPEFICCLGGVAATRLLDSRLTIGRMRGKFYDYMGAKVMATYHPAYLLRNPSARTYVWEDIKMLMGEMGLEIPGE